MPPVDLPVDVMLVMILWWSQIVMVEVRLDVRRADEIQDCDDDGNSDDLRAVCLVRAIANDLYR